MLLEPILAIHAHAPWAWPLLGAVVGSVLGSFAACMADRLHEGLGLRYPPSQCLACKTPLRVIDLIPIFSWLWRRGACGYCQAPIPVRLWLTELGGALLGAGLLWVLLP
jgi:prepilin signal peptidase PulO-like enzyme (type II secretory pathway)